jgi:hypothetical protein
LITNIVTPIPSANQSHSARRIAASARGLVPCPDCRPGRCRWCKADGPVHTFPRRPGGGVVTTVSECHSDEDCEARRGEVA